ncbi:hypothetical protein V6N11_059178 [Hibiscus sabdariffa]|uniref:Uncharacterized protein n=1 Tax=Hibiscus sabdariffa TaxID=183260 RepID=A0ABR2U703_9ROSI
MQKGWVEAVHAEQQLWVVSTLIPTVRGRGGWCQIILYTMELEGWMHSGGKNLGGVVLEKSGAGETSEPNQSAPQPPDDRIVDCPTNWSPWPSEREPTRHHTEVSSSGPSIVFEQAPIHTTFGGSSSYHPSHDDDVYRPQFKYPQPSIYGQGMDVQAMTSWLSTTIISSPLFAHSTPPSMQMMDDQLNEDEQTPDHLHPRRIVQAP